VNAGSVFEKITHWRGKKRASGEAMRTYGNPRGPAGAPGRMRISNTSPVTQNPLPDQRTAFQLTFQAEPHCAHPTLAWRKLLKFRLRSCNLKCTSVEEVR
jgi:hypothetical protein